MKKSFITLTAALTALSFSSCQNPYGPGASSAQRDAATGALIGTAAGALIGNQSDDALAGALIGGAVGAGAGYATGNEKDKRSR